MAKNKRRSDGRLQASVYLGVVDGRKKYKYVYATTERELKKKVEEVKAQLGKGLDLTAQRDTFRYWWDNWLKIKQAEISDKKFRAYKAKEKYIDHLFALPINKIHTMDVQSIIYDNTQLADDTLRQIRNILRQTFQLAVVNRVIDFNPVDGVRMPKRRAPEEKRRALTADEISWIENTPHRAQTAAMIMLYAGLRRGELIPLLWSDIDLAAGTISVTKSVEASGSELTVKKGAKSAAGERTVFIPDKLVNYLEVVKRTSLYVCPSASGTMLTDSAWKRLWDSYIAELNFRYGDFSNVVVPDKQGRLSQYKKPRSRFAPVKIPMVIEPFTAHYLRHTYITMLYFAGVDVLTAKEQAGHADIQTTMQIYTHLDKLHKQRQISKLNDYLSGVCLSDACQHTG